MYAETMRKIEALEQGSRIDTGSEGDGTRASPVPSPALSVTSRTSANERVVQGAEPAREIKIDMLKQLARIKIPVFSGNKKEYPHWRASFMECVDASGATEQYKLLQLKNVLAKGPLDFVSSLGHSKGAYQAALNRLDRKFGGERRALALRMEELDSISPIKDQPTF